MIPNKKGLKIILKETGYPEWENKIFTLTGGEVLESFLTTFYPVEEYEHEINSIFMVPLNSLKLLILNKKEKEN